MRTDGILAEKKTMQDSVSTLDALTCSGIDANLNTCESELNTIEN